MGDVSEAKEVFTELKRQILERVDLSRDVSDEEMQELIDEVVISYGKEQAVSLNERCRLKKELFHALRKMDVLQELLEEPDVTEIMVNGMNGIFLEKDGTLSRWEKNFYSGERIRAFCAGNRRGGGSAAHCLCQLSPSRAAGEGAEGG